MSSTVQVYTKGIEIEPAANEISVTLTEVDASDFISEFTVDEICSAMDFADVADWVDKRRTDDDEDFSGAE